MDLSSQNETIAGKKKVKAMKGVPDAEGKKTTRRKNPYAFF